MNSRPYFSVSVSMMICLASWYCYIMIYVPINRNVELMGWFPIFVFISLNKTVTKKKYPAKTLNPLMYLESLLQWMDVYCKPVDISSVIVQ